MKRILALSAAVLILLSGCSPIENRLDKRLIIQGIGIDKDSDLYTVTVMYMDTENPVGEADVTSSFVECSGESVLAALTDTANKTGREPLYGQCGFIILGDKLTKYGVKEVLNFFADYYEFSPNVSIFCADTEAQSIMKADNMNDKLMQDFADTEIKTGKTISNNLTDFYSAIIGGKSSAVTALVGLENGKAALKGAAAFNGDKLGSALTDEQCMAALLLCGRAKSIWDIFPSDENEKINYSLSDCKSSVKINTDGELTFDIYIKTKARIYGAESGSKVQSKIESRLTTVCGNAITQLLKSNQLDVFNLERELYSKNYGKYKELKDPAQSVILSKINTHIDVELQK